MNQNNHVDPNELNYKFIFYSYTCIYLH